MNNSGGYSKTQKWILKVGDSAQYTTMINNTVGSENDFVEHSNTKVENTTSPKQFSDSQEDI